MTESTKILTFDVEDWFHLLDHPSTSQISRWSEFESRLRNNMDRVLSLLDSRDLTATFFCLGWVADNYPEVVRQLSANGHEVATHSYGHELVFRQSESAFREDLARSIKVIEDLAGAKVTAYRAPGFSVGSEQRWVFEELVNQGIQIDCSIFPAPRAHGGFSAFTKDEPVWLDVDGVRIKEFPLNLARVFGRSFVFSGGGYFRILPERALDVLFAKSSYVMTYFHPRDFDPGQPVLDDLGCVRRFKSYVGLESAAAKFESLLDKYEFVSLREADSRIDWIAVDAVSL